MWCGLSGTIPIRASSHTVYEYDDDFLVIRYETATGKTVLPYHRKGDGWVNRQPDRPGGLPLYRLADLTDGARAFITEGEKACDAATAMGLPFVMASAGGSNSGAVAKTDWSPLAGHPVVILPDNDKPGEKYAKAVATKLHELGCTVKIVRLPDLPPKGDIVEFIEAHGGNPVDVRRSVLELMDNASKADPYELTAGNAPVLVRLSG